MGIVTGRVFNSQGKPVEYARVVGSVSGFLLFGTMETRTDRDGRFALEYSGVGQLNKIYLDGNEVMRDVRSGSNITLIKR